MAMRKAPQPELNPETPPAIESVDGLNNGTKLVILDEIQIRWQGQTIVLRRGKVLTPAMYGGLYEINRMISVYHVRMALLEQKENLPDKKGKIKE